MWQWHRGGWELVGQGERARKRIQQWKARKCLSTWQEEFRRIERPKVAIMGMLNKQ